MCDAVLVESAGLVTSGLAAVIAISDDGGLGLVKFTFGVNLQIPAAPIVPAVIAGSIEAAAPIHSAESSIAAGAFTSSLAGGG